MDDVYSIAPSSDDLVEKRTKTPGRARKNALDGPKAIELHKKIMIWYNQEAQRQKTNRFQMSLDEDYYDSLQWDEEEAQVLIDRGQAPVVYNEIKSSIDWMIGTERRMRMDGKVMARRDDGTNNAEQKTSLLKYLSDTNNSIFHRSRCFCDGIKAGMGVIEIGIRGDSSDELLYERYQDWRFTLYDSNSVEHDMSDSRYFFRWKDLDEDIALAYFPDRADIVRRSVKNEGASEAEDYTGKRTDPADDWQPRTGRYQPYDGSAFASSQRKIVRFYECWYRVPVMQKVFSNGDCCGQHFDPENVEHINAQNMGCGLYDKLVMEIRVAIYTTAGMVYEGKSPYRHGRIPFVVTWCYRRKRDNAPYGCIRSLRDAQDGLNKRHSKAHWILSTNQVKVEVGAVDDMDALRDEANRHDGMIVVNKGRMADVEISRDVQLAEEHLNLMDRDAQYIRAISGVTNENLGRQSNATSGVAISNRQEQGTVVTTEPFDNYRFALQQIGEIALSNIEQFYSEEKVIRIIGSTGQAKFVKLNAQDESGNILNDITAMHADFVMSEQDYKSTLRQAMFESLFDMMGRMAQMGQDGLKASIAMLDLVIDMADLPNKDELVKRIRAINGQVDPDAKLTQEQEKQIAEQQQKAAEAEAMQKRAAEANVQMLEAKVDNLIEQTKKVDAQRITETVTAMFEALQAAGIVATTPGVAPVADAILADAGFSPAPGGVAPGIPSIPQPALPAQPLLQTDGAQAGIGTVENEPLNGMN